MRARKRFGQHFLTDTGVLDRIDQAVALQRADTVLEIGPGRGALTDVLLGYPEASAVHYTMVELDRDLVPILQARYTPARYPNVQILNADILDLDLETLMAGTAWRIVGNLPYNISSPLILKLAALQRALPSAMQDGHFMLQREMASRLAAQPGTKAWGRLSVMVQLTFRVHILFDVAPPSFSPPPRVWSSVIALRPHPAPMKVSIERLDTVLKAAFSARRKRLANGLKALSIDWQAVSLDPDLRPDNVTLEQFVELTNAIS